MKRRIPLERAALLAGGLSEKFSANEILRLKGRLTVSEAIARSFENPNYYAIKLEAGAARLGEMLEESAFYSLALQRASATVMLSLLIAFAVLASIVAFTAIPFIQRDTALTVLRVILSVLVFVYAL